VLIASQKFLTENILMASQLASGDLVSDRYASALYDLAAEKKLVDPVLEDLSNLKNILKDNKELSLVVKSPLITSIDKLNIFESLLKKINANELTSTFLKVIEKNKRFSNLASIITQFMNINSQKRGDVLADITSADELNDDQKNNITNQLKSILGDKLSLSFDVDKNIMGGLIVKVGSKMIDTSLANKINKLKIAMKGA
jgi:F-type H+-transporting ATPase subunit delta